MMRVSLSSAIFCLLQAGAAMAQIPDDVESASLPAASVVEHFQTICVASAGNLSQAWALARETGWEVTQDVPFERYYWGVLPGHKVGLTNENVPGTILLLATFGNVTPDQRQAVRAGKRPSTERVQRGKVTDFSRLLGQEPTLGYTECEVAGRVSDMKYLYAYAEPLIFPADKPSDPLAHSRTVYGKHEAIYQNAGVPVSLSMGYLSTDGSGGFHLRYQRSISPNDAVELYNVPAW